MTLLQVQYFREVARTGNITSAADGLYVSRPAVSRAMRDLEKEFGITMFRRSNTGLALTEAGCTFYEACNDIQGRIAELEAQLAELKEKGKNQDIRLGLTPFTGIAIFPKFYWEFKKAYPDINFIILEHSHQQSRLMMEDGSMDAFFTTHTEGLSDNIGSLVLTQTQLVFCASASHPLAGYTSVSIDDIKDEPLVYMEEGMQREKEIMKCYRQIGRTPNIMLRTGQQNTLHDIVAEGIAASIQLHGSIDDGESVIGIPLDPPIRFQISLIWNRQAEERDAIKALRSFALKWRTKARKAFEK